MSDAGLYPTNRAARDRFVLDRRGPRPVHDPWQYQGVIVEEERAADGTRDRIATVFLTGRECPWRCAMCDLWRYTTETDTPRGAIAAQIRRAIASHAVTGAADGTPRHLKLYNAGSFFDPRAVPAADYPEIAAASAGFARVIVESHPSLIGPRVDQWLVQLDSQGAALEVAMGLETAHPGALERLNKRMTVSDFQRAASALRERGVHLRAFLLVSPPFIPPDEQSAWLARSIAEAFSCGAEVVSLIPMRDGNGTVEALAREGLYAAPTLDVFEDAFDLALGMSAGRVFADVWDLDRLSTCDDCLPARRSRLVTMNLTQRAAPRVSCQECENVRAVRPS